jgi:prolyl-tRNA synthetase
MGEPTTLRPGTDNPPAKVRDIGVINMVKAGAAAFNAKSGELLLLPDGENARRDLVSRLRTSLLTEAGVQPVDCGSDAAIFSLAERYLREWGDAASIYSEERGRELYMLGWSPDTASAVSRAEVIMCAILRELGDGGFVFLEEVLPENLSSYSLVSVDGGSLGTRQGFVCSACGAPYLPDSPSDFTARQPGADEPEEALSDVETPGANTIAELCGQLAIGVDRTIKAMLYVAFDDASRPRPVAAFTRGDFNVSMTKLSRWLIAERGLNGLRTAEKQELHELIGPVAGYCGPVGLPDNVTVVCDGSVRGAKNTVAGANRPGYHKKGCCHGRDFDHPIADIAQYAQGTPCPRCAAGRLGMYALRELGTLRFGAEGDGKSGKILSYRDKEGAHDYPVGLRCSLSLELVLLALNSRAG